MTTFLTNTFSPLMLSSGIEANIVEIALDDVPSISIMTSAISHEVTAAILSGLLEEPVSFNRVNLSLDPGDWVYAIIPSFRASEAREFTREEVESAGLRVFLIEVV